MSSFVHLHLHFSYSVLDGMSNIPALVDKDAALGMNATALIDHGNMFGIKEFYNYLKKKNGKSQAEIAALERKAADENLSASEWEAARTEVEGLRRKMFKPIIGSQVYVARRTGFDQDLKEDRSGYHLVLLAKNKTGYRNLSKLVSLGWTEGFYYRPRIEHDLLEKYRDGLTGFVR